MKAVVFATLAIVAAWLFWDPSFTDEVTLYSAQCEDDKKIYPPTYWLRTKSKDWLESHRKSLADCRPRIFSATTYRLNRERGVVAYKTHNGISRLVDCAIYDNKNWECNYPRGDREPFVVINGREGRDMSIPADSFIHSIFSVSKWQYYLIAILQVTVRPDNGSWLFIPEQFDSSR